MRKPIEDYITSTPDGAAGFERVRCEEDPEYWEDVDCDDDPDTEEEEDAEFYCGCSDPGCPCDGPKNWRLL